MDAKYDAILIVSFGGPEGRQDVIPFLENVLRGKNVPRERMLEVAEHYYHFAGASPINAQNRDLIAALRLELDRHRLHLPIYWGNRNWHPLLTDTVRAMQADGVRRALAFITSIFSSYSGCRQYLEDIERARAEAGEAAPPIDRIRPFFNHPGFVSSMAERVEEALRAMPASLRASAQIVYTAHSIPLAMARGCPYETQLQESCRLVSEAVGWGDWRLVYQSRSGPPNQTWLEPDVGDYLKQVRAKGAVQAVVVAPIGFMSDHMEVLYDLDVQAKQLCDDLGLTMIRAGTVGTHPQFVSTIRELIEERMSDPAERRVVGGLAACPDECPSDCCPSGRGGGARPV
jgi:protoporphyrin/coproporphyrin ferrochelatase